MRCERSLRENCRDLACLADPLKHHIVQDKWGLQTTNCFISQTFVIFHFRIVFSATKIQKNVQKVAYFTLHPTGCCFIANPSFKFAFLQQQDTSSWQISRCFSWAQLVLQDSWNTCSHLLTWFQNFEKPELFDLMWCNTEPLIWSKSPELVAILQLFFFFLNNFAATKPALCVRMYSIPPHQVLVCLCTIQSEKCDRKHLMSWHHLSICHCWSSPCRSGWFLSLMV